MTDEKLRAIRERHNRAVTFGEDEEWTEPLVLRTDVEWDTAKEGGVLVCDWDRTPWPCDAAVLLQAEPKPDGWHTYHVCGGLLRELTFLGRDGTVSEAMCLTCGEWYRGTVTPAPGKSADQPIAAAIP